MAVCGFIVCVDGIVGGFVGGFGLIVAGLAWLFGVLFEFWVLVCMVVASAWVGYYCGWYLFLDALTVLDFVGFVVADFRVFGCAMQFLLLSGWVGGCCLDLVMWCLGLLVTCLVFVWMFCLVCGCWFGWCGLVC